MAGEKTEKPTGKRRSEARGRGQVARSMEVNTAVVFAATIGALVVTAPGLLRRLEDVVRVGLERTSSPDLVTPAGLGEIARSAATAVGFGIAPVVLAAAVAGVLANVAQVRWKVTPKALKPSLKKLDPIAGAKRLLGPQGVVEGSKSLLKTAAVGLAVLVALWPKLSDFGLLVGATPGQVLVIAAQTFRRLALVAAAAFVVIGAADYAWQRRRHEKSLKMTKEEVKQESRQQDLAPEVRGAIKRRQFELARKRMLADVPTADVVVTNPTHFAVALRYDGSRPAPQVVAKGADLVAAAIRRVAAENGVPVLENPPLARALYREVDLGREIPESFFAAVAEVLAWVYRRAGRRAAG